MTVSWLVPICTYGIDSCVVHGLNEALTRSIKTINFVSKNSVWIINVSVHEQAKHESKLSVMHIDTLDAKALNSQVKEKIEGFKFKHWQIHSIRN